MPRSYVTLSLDLVEYADCAADYLVSEGYRVSVELPGLYYPNTPTLVGKRGSTEFIVEVASVADSASLSDWTHYGKARDKETFVALVLPEGVSVSTDELAKLRAHGIGVCRAANGALATLVEPVDLSMSIGLPDLAKERVALRRLLRPPFNKIAGGAVVDGFKDATAVIEKLAKAHLRKGVASGRLRFVNGNGSGRLLNDVQINRMTLGQLGVAYGQIVAPTQADDLTRRAIASVLKDRNDATHGGLKPSVVRRIKKNTPRHVLAILNAVRELN